ncbi:MAG: YSC84-related protein [Pseudomonadota bacterium]
MLPLRRKSCAALLLLAATALALAPRPGLAESASQIDQDVKQSLDKLYAESPEAKELSTQAKAILVFPRIVKAGLLLGGQYGDGGLVKGGKMDGYYNSTAVSYGLQAGVQWFGYAMFMMNDEAVQYLEESDGWEVGSGPSVVVWDQGAAGSMTSTSLKDDIYVFFFDQKGLMAGLGLQGTKITKISP